MQYFVTGATGFIGKRLVKKLLERKGAVVYFLLRKESEAKVADLRQYWGAPAARVVPVFGDITAKKLGVTPAKLKKLKGQIDHFYHLAAVYDLGADEASQIAVNIEGTRHTLELAQAIEAGHFHHMSSIAAAGLYEGVFREDMFEEAEHYEHPYFMTKHEREKIVRQECKLPWSVYRPALVVGDSGSGEMDKIDGPYYFFKLIQRMRQLLPPWMPSMGLEGGRINIVPVDFVVAALTTISHQRGIASKCYQLVDPVGYRVGDVLDIFSKAAHAPKMNLFINAALFGFIPRSVTMGLLPGMVAKGKGHVVNISSIGVLTNAPRFSAYVASKAALDAWTRCAASEFADQGVSFTIINMPLVRVATRLGITGQILHALLPRVAQIAMNTSFRMFGDSSAAKGGTPGHQPAGQPLAPEAMALQQMMRGIHF